MIRLALIVCCVLPVWASAELEVARIFRDHMVLQRDMAVPIWGWCKPGEEVTVRFAGHTVASTANADGKWLSRLPALAASDQGRELRVSGGGQQLIVRDVVVGEVWLASGQSNMAWTVGQCAKGLPAARDAMAHATHPLIRMRRITGKGQPTPQRDLASDQAWTVCSPETVGAFSGVSYFFAQQLHASLKVPVGVIVSAWGGTPIEPYIPRAAFVGHPTLVELGRLADKGDLVGVNRIDGGTFARAEHWLAGRIYNARIAPTVPYAIRGAIWYQAESNCGTLEDPRHYQHKMKALMRGWRQAWQQPRLPVYFVQLPRYTSYGWTFMRDEQRRALDAPDCGMVVTHDLKLDGIHPPNKIDVGERLARWPLAKVYAQDVVCSGPLYAESKTVGQAVHIQFSEIGGGLIVGYKEDLKPTVQTPKTPLFGFELADNEGGWHEAQARIQGDIVIVESPAVSQPVGVRYAMQPQPPAGRHWNLYNKAGLPASPFCSDQTLMTWERGQQ